MEDKFLIGGKIVHKRFGVGEILEVNGNIVILDFNGEQKKYEIDTLNQFFTFLDKETEKIVLEVIQRIKGMKEAEMAKRRIEEEERKSESDKLAAEDLANKEREKKEKIQG